MLNVSEAVKQAYINGNPHAETFITVGNVTYGPTNILAGSVSVVESICSAEQFTLNRVEKNSITFTLFNITEGISDLQGKSVSAKQRVTVNNISTDIPLGEFTVVDAVNDGDYLIKCTAYDSATLAMDASADAWWNTEITFPITIRQLLLALLNKIGVSHNIPLTFTNYDFTITQRPVFVEGTTYADIVGYIQEVIGGFLKPNRYGVIQLYRRIIAEGFYPKNGRYPSDTLYPKRSTTVNTFADEDTVGEQVVNYGQIVSGLTIADFTTQTVERVQVRGTADDIGIIVGQGTNTYVIEANPLMYGLSDATGRPIVQNIYNEIIGLTYIPFKGRFMGLPFMEAGDMVVITTYNDLHVESPVFKRTLCGSRLAFDELETNGVEELEQVEEVNRTITVLRQKTHEVENTVDGLRSTVTEVVTDLSALDEEINRTDPTDPPTNPGLKQQVSIHTSEIKQNSDAIDLRVETKNYTGEYIIRSLINVTDKSIKIASKNLDLQGYLTVSDVGSTGKTVIDGGRILTGSIILGGKSNQSSSQNVNGSLIVQNSSGNVIGKFYSGGIEVYSGTIAGPTIIVGGKNNTNGQLYVKNASNQEIVILNKDGVTVRNGGQITGAIINASTMYWNKNTNDQATIAGAQTSGSVIVNGIVIASKAVQISKQLWVNSGGTDEPTLLSRTDYSFIRSGSARIAVDGNASISAPVVAITSSKSSDKNDMSLSGYRIGITGSTKVQLKRSNTFVNLDGNASYLEYNNGYRQAIVAVHSGLAYLYAYLNNSQYAGIEANTSGLQVYTQRHNKWYEKKYVEWRKMLDADGNQVYALCGPGPWLPD